MENAKDIKEWCEEQWRGKLIHSGHGNVFVQGPGGIHTKAGTERKYKSKSRKPMRRGSAYTIRNLCRSYWPKRLKATPAIW